VRDLATWHKLFALLVATLLASCVSLTDAGRLVRVSGSEDAVQNCRRLGYVSASTGLRGIASLLAADERLMAQLRNKVARKGGNVLLLEEKHASVNEESFANGTAYHCAK
jgi:hypothetical protein